MSEPTEQEMTETIAKYERAALSVPPGKVNDDDVYVICGSFRQWVSRQFAQEFGYFADHFGHERRTG